MLFEELKKRFNSKGLAFWNTQGGITHTRRDWRVLFLVFVLALLGIIFFSAYLFLEINRGELYALPPVFTGQLETIDRSVLGEILLSFDEKARQLDIFVENPPAIPNPL